MSDVSVTLQRADDGTIGDVEALLARNGLPSADVRDDANRSNQKRFFVGYDGGDAVSIGGLEAYPPHGLLRSVVVEESVRGSGFGAATCEALEGEAREDGVETLYLLTTDASGFFAALGYEAVDRDEAPEAIRETREFSDLCPVSATCMRKRL